MTYNVEESGANDTWKDVVKEENPDILICVETGLWDNDGNATINSLVDEFNSYFMSYGEDNYTAITAQGVSLWVSGEAIFSRFSIINFTQISNVPLDNGSDYDVTHDFIDAVVDIHGIHTHIIGAHLKSSSDQINEWRRQNETEGIINYMDNLGNVPIVYMGDLNTFSPEDTGDLVPKGDLGYGPLTYMLDPDNTTYGNHSSLVHNFRDVYRYLNTTFKGYTYGHQDTQYESRIDFILVNDFFFNKLLNTSVGDTNSAYWGSDHYSVDVFIQWNDYSPPAITSGPTVVPGHEAAKITFTTNESTKAVVEYDTFSTPPYSNQVSDPVNSSSHSILLSNLTIETTYYFTVKTWDTWNNGPTTENGSFTTRSKHVVINEICFDGINVSSFEGSGNDGAFTHVIITEVYYDPEGEEPDEEWIELYNPTSTSESLSGWYFKDNDGVGGPFNLPAISIPAGGYVTITYNSTAFQELYGFQANGTCSWNGWNNGGDTVGLYNDSGILVDFVAYEWNSSWDLTATQGNSIYRSDTMDDSDDNTDWAVHSHDSDVNSGALTHSTTIYSERDEYFVLYNPTSSSVSLAGWCFSDGDGIIEFNTSISIAALDILIITKDADSFRQRFGIDPDYEWNSTWGNDMYNNGSIPDLIHVSGEINFLNSGEFLFFDNESSDSDNLSVDIVAWGVVSDFSNLPEGSYSGSLASIGVQGQAIRRKNPAEEGNEVGENSEDLNTTFELIFVNSTSLPGIIPEFNIDLSYLLLPCLSFLIILIIQRQRGWKRGKH